MADSTLRLKVKGPGPGLKNGNDLEQLGELNSWKVKRTFPKDE